MTWQRSYSFRSRFVTLTNWRYDWLRRFIGISVPQISLNTKKVTLKGMNNLQNSVVINSFDLPSNDPAGGITLTINSTVTNVCLTSSLLAIHSHYFLAFASRYCPEFFRIPSVLWTNQPWSGRCRKAVHPCSPLCHQSPIERSTC